ncbi:MAG: winged helix-turn-helix domain-containing protein [Candidatus Bathyarchaeia archaeon]|jgi:predicted transcriptional regulator
MFGKNRDKLSIVAAILEVAHSGATKTRIMYTANLSFKLVEKYLNRIVCFGFLEVRDSTYVLTDKGLVFLKKYRTYHEHFLKVKQLCEALEVEREMLINLCAPSMVDESEKSVLDAN